MSGQLIRDSLCPFLLKLFLDFAKIDGRAAAAAFGTARVFVRHKTAVEHPAHVGHCRREDQEDNNVLYHMLYINCTNLQKVYGSGSFQCSAMVSNISWWMLPLLATISRPKI
jgi:hypothetical protein